MNLLSLSLELWLRRLWWRLDRQSTAAAPQLRAEFFLGRALPAAALFTTALAGLCALCALC